MICDVCVNKSQCTKKGIVFCAGYFLERREQTNEEGFCGLSTKKKAKFFKDISEKCLNCGSAIDYDEIGECPFGRCRTGLNEYEDWLKEIHNG